jgi:hypothetical protein
MVRNSANEKCTGGYGAELWIQNFEDLNRKVRKEDEPELLSQRRGVWKRRMFLDVFFASFAIFAVKSCFSALKPRGFRV